MRTQHSRPAPYSEEDERPGVYRGEDDALFRSTRQGQGSANESGWPEGGRWRGEEGGGGYSGHGQGGRDYPDTHAQWERGGQRYGNDERSIADRYAGYGGTTGNFPGRESGRDEYGYGWNATHTGGRQDFDERSRREGRPGMGGQGVDDTTWRGRSGAGSAVHRDSWDVGQNPRHGGIWDSFADEAGFGDPGGARHGDIARDRQGPKGYSRSDERIREFICERLAQQSRLDVSDVSISVNNGCVTLEGTVPERRMKHAIEDAADNCWGVKEVENRLRVGATMTGVQALGGDNVGRQMGEAASDLQSGEGGSKTRGKA